METLFFNNPNTFYLYCNIFCSVISLYQSGFSYCFIGDQETNENALEVCQLRFEDFGQIIFSSYGDIFYTFTPQIFSTGPKMGKLDLAMDIFIEMFQKYATKDGDRLHLSGRELRNMFRTELCELLQVVGSRSLGL